VVFIYLNFIDAQTKKLKAAHKKEHGSFVIIQKATMSTFLLTLLFPGKFILEEMAFSSGTFWF